ncbi:GNAT family N-acetyltransferase [Aureimonas mangrovi]|uniref:GNAT family N-acetyltransferase n=1 Tax=Aureimonas mangrovi TaxID=2758041 RepID=UPI00163D45FF|nr:GNAT family N-acyltransferase [Aureimonas mangrovi]
MNAADIRQFRGKSPAAIAGLLGQGLRASWPVPRRRVSRTLGRLGGLEVRLAGSRAEIVAAKTLRYEVFCNEMGARPTLRQRLTRRDEDRFDAFCDHLIVLDHDVRTPMGPRVVATYRLLRHERARAAGGFYSAGEFDIAPMLARHDGRRFLELGRSCVEPSYRSRRTVELLWQGIWAFARENGIDTMFGCASLPGTDVAALTPALALLRESAMAPDEWQVAPLPHAGTRLPTATCADPRSVLRDMPPLVKGYLRIGGYVSDGLVVDHAFGTTDVFVILPVERIAGRYLSHYGEDKGRFGQGCAEGRGERRVAA